ncbi:MAG: PilZ domain-containing protein [Peptococcaceae bacterium]|nr:PilZ domain-containing protein [Peptococcaceae bacterium]
MTVVKYIEGRTLKKTLRAGLSVELWIKQGEYRGCYRTRIEDTEEGILILGVPYMAQGFVPVRPGEKIEVVFVTEAGPYGFEEEISSLQVETLPTFMVPWPKIAKRIQRRRFVRLAYFQDIQYQVMDEEKNPGDKQEAQTLDLSGGGLLLQTPQLLTEGDRILIYLKVKSEIVQIPSLVRRVEEVEFTLRTGDSQKRYRARIEFEEIPERIRDKIIRKVFDIQRDLRRRGLI